MKLKYQLNLFYYLLLKFILVIIKKKIEKVLETIDVNLSYKDKEKVEKFAYIIIYYKMASQIARKNILKDYLTFKKIRTRKKKPNLTIIQIIIKRIASYLILYYS